jgi:hypothetical protein
MSTPTTPDQPAKQSPWDQLPDEPAKAYSRFLVFLGMGPARSVHAAFRLVRPDTQGHKRSAPGAWHRAARRFDWERRAVAFDLHHLVAAGQQAVALFVATIAQASRKTLDALVESDVRPQTWADVLGSLQALAALIPAETIAAVSADQRAQGC